MALVIGGILALLGIAVAVYPFVARRFFGNPAAAASDDGEPTLRGDSARAEDELAEIYQAINTLRLERELGNIPEGLYREQLNGYRLRAARVLRQREAALGGGQDWSLEEEIRVARSGLYHQGVDGALPCANCGRPVPAGVSQCPECGAEVSPAGAAELHPTEAEEK